MAVSMVCAATLAVVCVVAPAHAQVPEGAPAEPSTWVAGELGGAWLSFEDVSGASFLLSASGAWAPLRSLEVGSRLDFVGAYLGMNDKNRGAGRIGLGVLQPWIGTGGAGGGVGFGGRLFGILGPRLIDLEGVDGGAPLGGFGVQIDVTYRPPIPLELTGEMDSAVVWEESSEVFMGGTLEAYWGDEQHVRVRPLVGWHIRWAPDLPFLSRPRAGAEVRLGDFLLTAVVSADLPTAPDGRQLAVHVTLLRPIDVPKPPP